MTFIAPLRSAVTFLCQQGRRFDIAAAAVLGQCKEFSALRYLRQLTLHHVLIQDDNHFAPGPCYDSWSKRRTCTKSGGNRLSYRQSVDNSPMLKDTQSGRLIMAARLKRGLSVRQLAERAGLNPEHLSRVERGKKGLGPIAEERIRAVLAVSESDPAQEPRRA